MAQKAKKKKGKKKNAPGYLGVLAAVLAVALLFGVIYALTRVETKRLREVEKKVCINKGVGMLGDGNGVAAVFWQVQHISLGNGYAFFCKFVVRFSRQHIHKGIAVAAALTTAIHADATFCNGKQAIYQHFSVCYLHTITPTIIPCRDGNCNRICSKSITFFFYSLRSGGVWL